MDNALLWLWLHSGCAVSRAKQHKLLAHFGDIESIYKAGRDELAESLILTDEVIERLSDKDLTFAKEEMSRLESMNGFLITIDSDTYPDYLRKIHSPPSVIYARGQRFDLNDSFMIAMVGTRKATKYGLSCAYNIARELSDAGAVVVSGLAMGIDSGSHEGALMGKSPTVAVVGCGIDVVYPRSNARLYRQICDKGLVLSEYPLGTTVQKYYFPERNRIISGISRGTIVVEADLMSGSLITAKYAAEQNRDVFAVPGNVNSVFSKGTNYLLKDGAHLVSTGADVLDFYEFECPEILENAKKENSKPASPEQLIISVLGEEILHKDIICERTGLDIGTINSVLLIMEIKGTVLSMAGGYYCKSK